MPPGTGDIQLTMAQKVPISGCIIITTPQELALLDAKKGIEMFTKVKVPIIGIVENMSYYHCSKCGHNDFLFGKGGTEQLAKSYNVPVLEKLPLNQTIQYLIDDNFQHPDLFIF